MKTAVPRQAWWASIALAAWGIAAVGMVVQNLDNLAPCPYCIFQRVLYFGIAAVALLGFLVPSAGAGLSWLLLALALLGAGVAAYQSIMQFYPALATSCGFGQGGWIEHFVDWLGMRWPEWFLATGTCSSQEWVFLGLSMANWSVGVFLALALGIWRLLRH